MLTLLLDTENSEYALINFEAKRWSGWCSTKRKALIRPLAFVHATVPNAKYLLSNNVNIKLLQTYTQEDYPEMYI